MVLGRARGNRTRHSPNWFDLDWINNSKLAMIGMEHLSQYLWDHLFVCVRQKSLFQIYSPTIYPHRMDFRGQSIYSQKVCFISHRSRFRWTTSEELQQCLCRLWAHWWTPPCSRFHHYSCQTYQILPERKVTWHVVSTNYLSLQSRNHLLDLL